MNVFLNVNWFSKNLKEEVVKVFQPYYEEKLTDGEVKEIALNLTNLVDLWLKFNWRVDHV